MRGVAFAIGALAAGVAFALLTALGLWIASLLLGHPGPLEAMPVAVPLVGLAAGLLTYIDEVLAWRAEKRRADQLRARAMGEPWAYDQPDR